MNQEQSPSLGDALKLWQERLAYLEIEKAKTASASQKFELQDRIEECRKEIQRLKNNSVSRNKFPIFRILRGVKRIVRNRV
ncbi:hypothetical protein [Microseira wollei]|uniref:Uncharacterized protein n=1 Tax=Microseira wollei NIES-4236 TaxID=2530354 RepID=A0AAV3X9C3_9CYAN|nr:hypothetical protein [Microseira wollei]GET37906.1 hypothetical protein MiSe_26600 [Microseira wollei NIES-4236]